ncbi:DNA integrity scanning protein DisA [Botrimarina colliarenosi]|uniref:DNA integrity scanning protein DisA n=1 Tax=Botrimarina colliarenosi TaxID=2528001 RepID=A0A5C6ACD7_9BACT|nr:diadenylate cyclase [Botrimarina colliarenosi]TWT96988.1 DNA integrity scanning protein DisA [Botrimarina colliarenosi]
MASPRASQPRRFTPQLEGFCKAAAAIAEQHNADAVLFLAERPIDWRKLQEAFGTRSLLVAADSEDQLAGAHDEENGPGLETILLAMNDAPVYERLTQALLEAVADEFIETGSTVVTLYSSYDPGVIDSVSLIRLDEHLGRLTVRDLRRIETKIPTETLKSVIDLAVEIGREGREGKPIGTLMVVGDHRRTLEMSKPMGFDPVKGYPAAERSLADSKVRDGVKEIAQMDGAFIISNTGTVIASAQHLSGPPSKEITLSKGLGARHWAAAQITHATDAIAVAVSSSGGTVRVFQGGEVVLRIEPLERAMTWREFEAEHEGEKEKPPEKKPSKVRSKTPKPKTTKATPDAKAADTPADAGG